MQSGAETVWAPVALEAARQVGAQALRSAGPIGIGAGIAVAVVAVARVEPVKRGEIPPGSTVNSVDRVEMSSPAIPHETAVGGGFISLPERGHDLVTVRSVGRKDLPGFGSTEPIAPADEFIPATPVARPTEAVTPTISAEQQRRSTELQTVIYQGDDGYIGITDDFDRRLGEHARQGRTIQQIHDTGEGKRDVARGVEQILIERGRAAGNEANLKQNNSIDPSRTDTRAESMRAQGRGFLDQQENESNE